VLKRGVQMGFVTPIVHALTYEDWIIYFIKKKYIQFLKKKKFFKFLIKS